MIMHLKFNVAVYVFKLTARLIFCQECPASQKTPTSYLEFKLQKYNAVQYRNTCSMQWIDKSE